MKDWRFKSQSGSIEIHGDIMKIEVKGVDFGGVIDPVDMRLTLNFRTGAVTGDTVSKVVFYGLVVWPVLEQTPVEIRGDWDKYILFVQRLFALLPCPGAFAQIVGQGVYLSQEKLFDGVVEILRDLEKRG